MGLHKPHCEPFQVACPGATEVAQARLRYLRSLQTCEDSGMDTNSHHPGD